MSLDLLARFLYPFAVEHKGDFQAQLFYDVGSKKKNRDDDMVAVISRMPLISAYLKLIGRSAKLDYLHPKVIQAYIIGNELLKVDMEFEKVEQYIQNEIDRHPGFVSSDLFHHNLHANKIGDMKRDCPPESVKRDMRVIPGTVRVLKNMVAIYPLEGTDSRRMFSANNPFNIQGNQVAVHRKTVVTSLDEQESNNLVKYGFKR